VREISQKVGSIKVVSAANTLGAKGKTILRENIRSVSIRKNIVV
jgi:hypothetical protein